MRHPARRVARGERGSTLVEFTIASMMFFTVIFGTIDFTIAVWRYNMVANLAQEGVRYASVHGANSVLPGTYGTTAAVESFVNGRDLNLITVITTTPGGPPSGKTPGQTVSVTVSNNFVPLAGLLSFAPFTLSSTAQMIMAR